MECNVDRYMCVVWDFFSCEPVHPQFSSGGKSGLPVSAVLDTEQQLPLSILQWRVTGAAASGWLEGWSPGAWGIKVCNSAETE